MCCPKRRAAQTMHCAKRGAAHKRRDTESEPQDEPPPEGQGVQALLRRRPLNPSYGHALLGLPCSRSRHGDHLDVPAAAAEPQSPTTLCIAGTRRGGKTWLEINGRLL